MNRVYQNYIDTIESPVNQPGSKNGQSSSVNSSSFGPNTVCTTSNPVLNNIEAMCTDYQSLLDKIDEIGTEPEAETDIQMLNDQAMLVDVGIADDDDIAHENEKENQGERSDKNVKGNGREKKTRVKSTISKPLKRRHTTFEEKRAVLQMLSQNKTVAEISKDTELKKGNL